jgi:tetratricopeptide (TPR) repeat protein
MHTNKFIPLFMIIGFTLPGWSQSGIEALESAFKSSYIAEKEENYQLAAHSLEAVYAPESYELNLRLGWLHYLQGELIKSADFYKKAITLLPYSIEAKLGYVLPISTMGNWNEVVMTYESILAQDPQNTLVNYRMGSIWYKRKDYQKAYQYLERVVNLYPFDYDSVILLAWTNYQSGKLREAKVLFEKAMLINPGDQSAREGLSLIQ